MDSKDSDAVPESRVAPEDSAHWSAERKQQAGRMAANRLAQLRASPAWRARARRITVISHLAVLVAESGQSRAKVAEKASMKPAQLSRMLGDDANLTLDSISRICEATGYDFDVVFRRATQLAALQPWQQRINRASVLEMVRQRSHAAQALSTRELLRGHYVTLTEQEAANSPNGFADDGLMAA